MRLRLHVVADPEGWLCVSSIIGIWLYNSLFIPTLVLLPHYHQGHVSWALVASYYLTSALCIMALFRASTADPGQLHGDIHIPLSERAKWELCAKCNLMRPRRAHHCRRCGHCVRKMDHHCPWINNCVGELNQKYFIQFLFYTGMASLYSMALVVSAWVWRIRSEREGDGDKGEEESPSKHLIVAHYIILLVESILFGVFVMVIFYDQLVSIITDETPIEQMKNRLMKDRTPSVQPPPHTHTHMHTHTHTHTRKPKLALLREVFGRGSVFCWLFPLHSSPPSVGGISYSAVPDYDV